MTPYTPSDAEIDIRNQGVLTMRVLCLPLYVLGCITFPAWYAVVCVAEFAATPFNDRWLRWSSDAEFRFKQWGRWVTG